MVNSVIKDMLQRPMDLLLVSDETISKAMGDMLLKQYLCIMELTKRDTLCILYKSVTIIFLKTLNLSILNKQTN